MELNCKDCIDPTRRLNNYHTGIYHDDYNCFAVCAIVMPVDATCTCIFALF